MTTPRPVCPAITAVQGSVQIEDTNSPAGHRPIRLVAWSIEGDALVLHENRLIRAEDHPHFLSVTVRNHAADQERWVAATPGWRAIITSKEHAEPRIEDIALWHILGPMDIRPIVRRADMGEGYTQRLYDSIMYHEVVKIIPPSGSLADY